MDNRVYWWHEKYKPRKPKYFNRVHTGWVARRDGTWEGELGGREPGRGNPGEGERRGWERELRRDWVGNCKPPPAASTSGCRQSILPLCHHVALRALS